MQQQKLYQGKIPMKFGTDFLPVEVRHALQSDFERELSECYREEFPAEYFFRRLNPEHREDLASLLAELEGFAQKAHTNHLVIGFGSVLYHDARNWPPTTYRDVDLRMLPETPLDMANVLTRIAVLEERLEKKFKVSRECAEWYSPFTAYVDFLYGCDVLHLTSKATGQLFDLNLPHGENDLARRHLTLERMHRGPFSILYGKERAMKIEASGVKGNA